MIYDPSREARTLRRSEFALGIDMAPTILDFAGIQPPKKIQGVTLKPLVAGEQAEEWRESFFYEHWFTANGRIVPSEGVRNSRWKYGRYLVPDRIEDGESRWEELFDLRSDPHETPESCR